MYGYPKPVSLDEALRRPRGGGRPEFPETDVDEVADSDAIRWDERQNLLASSRSEGSFRSSKRFRTNDDREWLGGSREVGPRDVESAYFHNLIDRWKKLSLFGEDEIDRGSAHWRARSRSSVGVLQMLWGSRITGLCRSRTSGTSQTDGNDRRSDERDLKQEASELIRSSVQFSE